MSRDSVWLLRYRKPILVTLALVTLALASQLHRLRFDFSPQQLYETVNKDEEWDFFEEMARTFGRDDATLFVVLDAGEHGHAVDAEHRRWLTRLTETFQTADGVVRAVSLSTALTVRGAASGDLEVRPAGELSSDEILADPLLVGSLVSPDGRLALALIDYGEERREVSALAQSVAAVRGWIADNPPPRGSTAGLAGVPAVRVDAVESMQREQVRFAPLVGGVLALLLLLAFRRVSRVLIALLTVALSIVWTMSLMAIAGVPVDVLNNVLPTLILVIGISDGLHMMVRDRQEHEAGRPRAAALSTAVRTLVVACLLTSFTTAAGFASLSASSTAILARFGVLVAIGVMISYLLSIGVLPQLLSFAPPPQRRTHRGSLARSFALRCGGIALRWPKATLIVGLALGGVLAAVGFSRVEVSVRLTDLYEPDHPLSVMQKTVDRELGGVLAMSAVVTLPMADAHMDPVSVARLAELQRRVGELPGVASTRSVADYVAAMHRSLAPDDPSPLPTTRQLLAQEWLVTEMSGEPLPIEPFVADGGQRLRVVVRVADAAASRSPEIALEAQRIGEALFADVDGASVRLTGDVYMAARNLTHLIHDLFTSLLLASAVIFLTLLAVFRSVRFALVGVIPNALPLVAIVGFMGLVGMDLDVANVVTFSIALGLAVDDTIHVLARFREEQAAGGTVVQVLSRTLAGSGQAVVLTSVVLGGGMLLLTFSDFVATARFGGLTALSLAVAVVADLMLLPAMLLLVYRRQAQTAPVRESVLQAPAAALSVSD